MKLGILSGSKVSVNVSVSFCVYLCDELASRFFKPDDDWLKCQSLSERKARVDIIQFET